LVDDLGLSFESVLQVRKQIGKFLGELSPTDLVAIIRTGGEVGALQQFTNDRRVLQSAVDHLRWNPCSRVGITALAPIRSTSDEGIRRCTDSRNQGSTLASLKFVLEGMRSLPGRKSLIILSDNLPVEQQEAARITFSPQRANSNDLANEAALAGLVSFRAQLGRVAELAIRASVVIYAVDAQGLQTTGITAADEISAPQTRTPPDQDPYLAIIRNRSRALRIASEGSGMIAKQTGGFLIRNSNDYGLQRVMEDQQGYYLIGFRPAESTFDRKFHPIRARVTRSGMEVRTRAGFYGFTNEQTRPPEPTVKDQINRALISPFGANEITLHLTTIFVDEASGGTMLRSFLYFDPRDLTFTDAADGSRVATFKLRGFLFGDNGKVVEQLGRTGTLSLRGNTYDRALRDGIVYGFDIPVKQSGAFQFRVAILDSGSTRIGTAGEFVDIPDLHSGQLALSGIVVRDALNLVAENTESAVRRSAPNTEPETVKGGLAVRRFNQGTSLIFAYAVYNARLDGATHLPKLSTQTRVFRDGRAIFSGDATPIDLAGQTDLQRIASASRLQLGAQLTPGEYVLQIIVTDSSGKEKPRVVTRWIDFEVIK
jgi:VWFA-related protein